MYLIAGSFTGTTCERSTHCSAQTTLGDLHQLKQIFPENDVIYLEKVLENCGTVNSAVAEILGDKESSTDGMRKKTQFISKLNRHKTRRSLSIIIFIYYETSSSSCSFLNYSLD